MKLRKLTSEERPPVLLALTGMIGIGPMGIFRLFEGNFLVAAIDFAAVLGFFLIAWSIYVKSAVKTASYCMALVAIGTAVTTVSIRGGDQFVWMYPALVSVFYLIRARDAIIVAGIAVIAVMPVVFELGGTGTVAVYLMSLGVTLALSVAFASSNAMHRRELKASALLDPLTGAGNRRALEQELDSAVAIAQSRGEPFALAMFDIDHFKTVNDIHGHSIGDSVLKRIAEVVSERIRPSDRLFRAGGEEFVIIARATDLESSQVLVERLRVAIADSITMTDESSESLSVTASFGLAQHIEGESRDALYKRADDALYEAKRSGRNRAHLSEQTISLSGTASYTISPALLADADSQELSEAS